MLIGGLLDERLEASVSERIPAACDQRKLFRLAAHIADGRGRSRPILACSPRPNGGDCVTKAPKTESGC